MVMYNKEQLQMAANSVFPTNCPTLQQGCSCSCWQIRLTVILLSHIPDIIPVSHEPASSSNFRFQLHQAKAPPGCFAAAF